MPPTLSTLQANPRTKSSSDSVPLPSPQVLSLHFLSSTSPTQLPTAFCPLPTAHSDSSPSPKPRRAPAHDLTLTHQLCIELAAVEREVDVEIHAVKSALGCIHALEILFEVLAAEVRSQGDDFFDTYTVAEKTIRDE